MKKKSFVKFVLSLLITFNFFENKGIAQNYDRVVCPQVKDLRLTENHEIQGEAFVEDAHVPLKALPFTQNVEIKGAIFTWMGFDEDYGGKTLGIRCRYKSGNNFFTLQGHTDFEFENYSSCYTKECGDGSNPSPPPKCYGICPGCIPGTCLNYRES